MKIKKIVVIIIAVLIPLVITTLVALYSYGAIGNWTKTQDQFIDTVYESKATSQKIVDTYITFNSYQYRNHSMDAKLYDNYLSSSDSHQAKNGYFTLDNMKFSIYVTMGEDDTYNYEFYFFDIDNTSVDIEKIAIIFFESTSKDSMVWIKQFIHTFKEEFEADNLYGIYTNGNLTKLTKNKTTTSTELLLDITGKAKPEENNNYLYSQTLTYSFAAENIKEISSLSFCNFVIASLNYDENNDPLDLDILGVGEIDNIYGTKDAYQENFECLDGYSSNILKALRREGYTKFAMPKVALHSSIALVISTILGVAFYFTWKTEASVKDTKNKTTQKKK